MKKISFFSQIMLAMATLLFCCLNASFGQCDTLVITDEQSYFENFSGEGFTCWTVADTLNTGKWQFLQGSENSAIAYTCSYGSSGAEGRIISPVFDLSGISSARLSFVYNLVPFLGPADELTVWYRTSETDTWHNLGTPSAGSGDNYLEQSYTLEDLSATYQISFFCRSMGGLVNYVTNIEIVSAGGCARPTSVQVSDVTTTTAILAWDANSGETSWTVELNGTESPMGSNPFTLTGLTPRTSYTVRVKANCGDNNSSDWSTPIAFTTACDVITVTDDSPYIDDFERSDDFVCWTSDIVTGTYGWFMDHGYLTPNNSASLFGAGEEARLISAPLDVTAVTEPTLVFKRKQPQGQTDVDELSVWYRTSATEEWQQAANYLFPTSGFETMVVALPNPSATYQIAFKGKANNGDGVYVDDVAVGAASAVATITETSSFTAIYPNPTTGTVTVASNAIGADLTVFDLFGKQLMNTKVSAASTELDFSGFAAGIYMVRIANATNTTTIKVVKE